MTLTVTDHKVFNRRSITGKEKPDIGSVKGCLMRLITFSSCTFLLMIALILLPSISMLHAATTVSGRIGTDTIWTKAGSPYLVTGNVSVYGDTTNQVTLTIEPGTEIRFSRGVSFSLGNNGGKAALIAEGSADNPITFTADADSPAKGYWQGIRLYSGTVSEATKMVHCVVEYAGYSDRRGIYLYSASPAIRDCLIRETAGHGIYCVSASPVLENNQIRDNSEYGIYCLNTACLPVITGNTIADNGLYPLSIGADSLGNVKDNTFEGNGEQAIMLLGERISRNTTWQNIGLAYVISGEILVYGDKENGVKLTIEPGVELGFIQKGGLIIGSAGGDMGTIEAAGTTDAPILFTAHTKSPKPGHWRGVYFQAGTISEDSGMEHCIIEYAGYNEQTNEQRGISLSYASPVIRNCQVRKNIGHGIYGSYSSSSISGNIISDNSLYGIYCTGYPFPFIIDNEIYQNTSGGIYNESSASGAISYNDIYKNGHGIYHNGSKEITLSYNNIYNNNSSSGYYEVYNNSGQTIQAQYNWWGDTTQAEINQGGNPKNLTGIYDKFDNGSKGVVDYAHSFGRRLVPFAEIPLGTELKDSCVYAIEPVETEQLILRNTQLYLGDKAIIASLTMKENSAIYPLMKNPLNLEVTGDLTIQQGCTIDVSGKGFSGGNQGPGKTLGNADGSTLYAGGSHAGPGGTDTNSSPNRCYGNVYFPQDSGSGGGAQPGSSSYVGGCGGGVIKLTVAGTIILDGTIAANGGDSSSHGGGGSGGSIRIDANVIIGSGSIEAKGGKAIDIGGGGGGGRIAVYYHTLHSFYNLASSNNLPPLPPSDLIYIRCYGGSGSGSTNLSCGSGGAGTIFLQDKSLEFGDLIINNEGIFDGARPTELTLTGLGPGNNSSLSANQLCDGYANYPVPDLEEGTLGLIGL